MTRVVVPNRMPLRAALAAALALLVVPAPSARAQVLTDVNRELEGLEIVERPDSQVPLDLPFLDEKGRATTLRACLVEGRPTILVMAYYDCPTLCTEVLSGLVRSLQAEPMAEWTPGDEYQILTVSIDPTNTPDLAAAKRTSHLKALGRPALAHAWRFLLGKEEEIRAVADSVGFRYRYVPEQDQYAHAAGFFLLTPDGRVSRTLTGIQPEPRTLRLSLVEASEGRIGSPMDQVILFCFDYDSRMGRYSPAIMNLMRIAGGLAVLIVAGWLITHHVRAARRARRAAPPTVAEAR